MKDIHWAVIFILVWSLKSGNGMNTGTSGITTTKPKVGLGDAPPENLGILELPRSILGLL